MSIAHKFFCCDFFVCDKADYAAILQIGVCKVIIVPVQRSCHDLTAIRGDTPTTCARDLGDEAMGVEAAKGAAELGTVLSGIVCAGAQMNA